MDEIRDFSGGLNTVSSLEHLQKNECTDLTNLDISETGKALIRRYGMIQTSPKYASWLDIGGKKWREL